MRAVFLIGPDKKIKAMLTYPTTSWRNFGEVLRLLDSLQLTVNSRSLHQSTGGEAEDVIIVPSISDEQAREKSPGGWKALKPYLRIVPPPAFF